jgi:hypothetical protein
MPRAAVAWGTAVLLASVVAATLVRAEAPPAARAAIEKALPLIEKGGAGYLARARCFSCHHQAVSVLALTAARDRGLPVDAANLQAQAQRALDDLREGEAGYREGRGQGGGIVRAGYALWTLQAAGIAPNGTTAAVAGFALQKDRNHGFWTSGANRPPSEASHFTSTFLGLRTLSAFGAEQDPAGRAARVAAARKWVSETQPKEHEDRVFRLLALIEAAAPEAEVAAGVRALRDTQHAEGGWAQLPDLAPDAYATGTALFALRRAGQAPDAAYRRGVEFLIRTQLPDGSWKVVSRSRPFQPYFESGFPHGKDQWISMAATCWAVAALAETLPPRPPG